jgi:hypothetical protein
METAYTDAAGRSNPDDAKINFETGKIGGKTLTPDVYTFTVDVQITGDIYLDAGGDADAVFIIQTTGNIIQAANTNVILSGSAKAENIFWQVAERLLLVQVRIWREFSWSRLLLHSLLVHL